MRAITKYLFLILLMVFAYQGFAQAQAIAPAGVTSRAASQQIFWYDTLPGRASFLQVTNTNASEGVWVHVQIYQSHPGLDATDPAQVVKCAEINFVDFLTARDTHVYDMQNVISNIKSDPVNVIPFPEQTPTGLGIGSKGFVLITPIRDEFDNRPISFQHLVGSTGMLLQGGTAYRINSMGRDAVDFNTAEILPDGTELDGTSSGFVLLQPEELFFNFAVASAFSDVVLMTFIDEYNNDSAILGYRAQNGETTLSPFIHDDQEQRTSCTPFVNTCFDDRGISFLVSPPANPFLDPPLGAAICGNVTVNPSPLTGGIVGWVRLIHGGYDALENQVGLVGYIDSASPAGTVAGADWMLVSGERTEPMPEPPMEVCDDGVDNDGDGDADCLDSDCDTNEACETGNEQCSDMDDNDMDGATDCADAGCDGFTGPEGQTCEFGTETSCDDGFDNDGDMLVDADDPDCQEADGGTGEGDGDGGGCTVATAVTASTAAANFLLPLLPLAGAYGYRRLRRRSSK